MPKSSTTAFSFLSGYVQDRNTARVIAQIDELKRAGATASRLMTWSRKDAKWVAFDLEWHATRLCMIQLPERRLLAVGPVWTRRFYRRKTFINNIKDNNNCKRTKTTAKNLVSHFRSYRTAEFIEKLTALIPPARIHLTRFFVCLAPHAKIRSQIITKKPLPPVQAPASGSSHPNPPFARRLPHST